MATVTPQFAHANPIIKSRLGGNYRSIQPHSLAKQQAVGKHLFSQKQINTEMTPFGAWVQNCMIKASLVSLLAIILASALAQLASSA